MLKQAIEKAVVKSQHCQRNWDLTREIPQEDIKVIQTAVESCPSKQNVVYYKPYFITDREIIEAIYEASDGFTINYETGESRKNPQVLANLVVALVEDNEWVNKKYRNYQTKELNLEGIKKDRYIAVGIAAGYMNLTAALLGYSTGCCQCIDNEQLKKILCVKNSILLLMGIGYSNKDKNRRIDHKDEDFIFPTFDKKIETEFL